MYAYRNKKTGAEMKTTVKVSGANWELIGGAETRAAVTTEPVEADPVDPDPPQAKAPRTTKARK